MRILPPSRATTDGNMVPCRWPQQLTAERAGDDAEVRAVAVALKLLRIRMGFAPASGFWLPQQLADAAFDPAL